MISPWPTRGGLPAADRFSSARDYRRRKITACLAKRSEGNAAQEPADCWALAAIFMTGGIAPRLPGIGGVCRGCKNGAVGCWGFSIAAV